MKNKEAQLRAGGGECDKSRILSRFSIVIIGEIITLLTEIRGEMKIEVCRVVGRK